MRRFGKTVCAIAGHTELSNAKTALVWFRCYEAVLRKHGPYHGNSLIEANHRTILAEQRLARLTTGETK